MEVNRKSRKLPPFDSMAKKMEVNPSQWAKMDVVSMAMRCNHVASTSVRRHSLCFSMNYRDFSVKSKLIISLFQTVKLSLSISLFQKSEFREIMSFSC